MSENSVELIAKGVKEYVEQNNLNVTNDEIEAISWNGLIGSVLQDENGQGIKDKDGHYQSDEQKGGFTTGFAKLNAEQRDKIIGNLAKIHNKNE